MSKKDEAMKLALEALKMCRALIRINIERLVPIESPNPWFSQDVDHAITAIREELAEQPAQQEPVGRLESDPDEGHVFVPRIDGDWSMLGEDLYTSPPAQRTWVGLTDKEVAAIYGNDLMKYRDGDYLRFARAIEAILREKNT